MHQLYLSDAFTQKERDDLAEWLASDEATRQAVSSAIQWRAEATNDRDNPTEALALTYIDARAVHERLDPVCGPEGW